MSWKKITSSIPMYPLSAILFYLGIVLLWNIHVIPPPSGLIPFLRGLYDSYGLVGIFIASFLEGLAYFGLYFPGTTIIFLGFIFAEGNFYSLMYLVITIVLAITVDSIVNYWAGRYFRYKNTHERFKEQGVEKSLFIAVIHPNLLAFYFFHRGLKKEPFSRVLLVPVILIVYGVVIAALVSTFSSFVQNDVVGNPYVIFMALTLWFTVSLVFQHKKSFMNGINRIYKHLFH